MSNQTPTHAQIEIRRRKFARKMGGTESGKGKTGNGMERYRGGIRLENGRQRIREMKFIKWNVHGGFSYIQN